MKRVSKRNYADEDKITVSIRIPADLKRRLDELAADHGRSFADFVQEGLDQWAALHDPELKEK